jgi:hypothetical protein
MKKHIPNLKRWQIVSVIMALIVSPGLPDLWAQAPASMDAAVVTTPTAASNRADMERFTKAFAEGDFKTIESFVVFEYPEEREMSRRVLKVLGEQEGSIKDKIELIHVQQFGSDRLLVCFLMKSRLMTPDFPVPLQMLFRREQGRWQSVGGLFHARATSLIREMGAEKFGRRTMVTQINALRFGQVSSAEYVGHHQALLAAFESIAKEYPDSPFAQASFLDKLRKQLKQAKELTDAKLHEAQDLSSIPRLKQLLLEQDMRNMMPKPDDFVLAMYLEAANPQEARQIPMADAAGVFKADPMPCLTEDNILKATIEKNSAGYPAVNFTLTKRGGELFSEITKRNLQRRLAMVVEGKVVSAPVIQSQISGGKGMITGNFTEAETQQLADHLNSYRQKMRDTMRAMEEELIKKASQ